MPEYPPPEEPAYGTLRYMYKTPNQPIDDAYIQRSDFDGWVYPNGETYTINPSQFQKSGNKFVTYDSNPFIAGNKLTVPDFRDRFMKLNPFTAYSPAAGSSRQCSFAQQESHVAVPTHEHLISDLKATV